MGATQGPDCAHAWLDMADRPEGASSKNGQVQGCYLHGIFTSDAFRAAWLAQFAQSAQTAYDAQVEETLDALAQHLETHMDLDALLQLAQPVVEMRSRSGC